MSAISGEGLPIIPEGDFAHEAFDKVEEGPLRTVLLLYSTPRSGSTMVCDQIRRTGLCVTHEYFQPWDYRPAMEARWGVLPGDHAGYLRALIRHRTGPTGWLGINLHGHHVPMWEAARPALPDTVDRVIKIRIRRRDVHAQAVSYYIARQTGAWSSAYENRGDVVYDADKIAQGFGRLQSMEADLDAYLKDALCVVPTFWYEDLCKDMKPIFDILGVQVSQPRDDVRIRPQSGKSKTLFTERFRKDMRFPVRISRKLSRTLHRVVKS